MLGLPNVLCFKLVETQIFGKFNQIWDERWDETLLKHEEEQVAFFIVFVAALCNEKFTMTEIMLPLRHGGRSLALNPWMTYGRTHWCSMKLYQRSVKHFNRGMQYFNSFFFFHGEFDTPSLPSSWPAPPSGSGLDWLPMEIWSCISHFRLLQKLKSDWLFLL